MGSGGGGGGGGMNGRKASPRQYDEKWYGMLGCSEEKTGAGSCELYRAWAVTSEDGAGSVRLMYLGCILYIITPAGQAVNKER